MRACRRGLQIQEFLLRGRGRRLESRERAGDASGQFTCKGGGLCSETGQERDTRRQDIVGSGSGFRQRKGCRGLSSYRLE